MIIQNRQVVTGTVIVPQRFVKGGLLQWVSSVCVSIPNYFPNDNLRTKSQIEAKCGMYVYLMNI